MHNKAYRGRIHQCIESLDYGDACSNHVLKLHKLLVDAGYVSNVYAEFIHTAKDLTNHLSQLSVEDEDIVICHYSGYSANVIPYVSDLRCTRIILYHNITPHDFFEKGSEQYLYCKQGREQLPKILPLFHYFWAVSNYNLAELIALGADEKKTAIIPIIVDPPSLPPHAGGSKAKDREAGTWLFVGRVAPNKGHLELLDAYHETVRRAPHAARRLYLVGNRDSDRAYCQQVLNRISELGLQDHVVMPGKVSDSELETYFQRSDLYISMSRHEGFGAPLIEAVHRELPVLALSSSAVGETLGSAATLFAQPTDLPSLAARIVEDPDYRAELVNQQRFNALRFSSAKASLLLQQALEKVIPSEHQFERVSVVICTRNRADLLERALEYLQFQTNPNFEVVVVDGSSTDHTGDVLRRYCHCVKVSSIDEANLSKSRNEGIALAAGDIISFIDDDSIPFDDFVDTVLAEFNRRPLTTAGLGGPVYFRGTLAFQAEDIAINHKAEVVNLATPCWSDSWSRVQLAKIGSGGWERSLLGTNASYRADILRENGGFDEQFDYFLDESEVSFRLQKRNYIVAYRPDLFVRHEFAQSSNRLSKYNFNWYSICKNTAYFVAVYSGLTPADAHAYLLARLHRERKAGLDEGLANGELTSAEHAAMCRRIDEGMKQGLLDAAHHPKTRKFASLRPSFLAFPRRTNFPTVGRTLRPLHICIVSKELQPFTPAGGNGTQFYHLTSELLLLGHHVTAIVPGDSTRTYRQGRLTVEFRPRQNICPEQGAFEVNINWSLTAFAAAAEVHRHHPIDVIESTLWDSEALPFSLLDRARRPVVAVRLVTPYAMAAEINRWQLPQLKHEQFNTAEKKLIQNADLVMPISDCIANTISKIHCIAPDRRWVKSYCGIAPWPSFDPWENYSDLTHIGGKRVEFTADDRIILFVGRLESRKGVDLLLQAAPQVLAEHRDAVLVLAGQDVEGFENRAGDYFTKDCLRRVYFLGAVDNNTRDKLLHAAYCLVFPSRYESFGFVPVEAFVHGCPVVAMRAGAIPEVVSHEHAGLLFEDGDVSGLTACLHRLLCDRALRDRLASGASQRRHMFSARRMAIDAVRAYHRCLKDRESSQSAKPFSREEVLSGSLAMSFSAKSPRLHTGCGLKQGDQIVSSGRDGTLLYGPYLDLEPGDYIAKVYGRISKLGARHATASVTTNAGAETLVTARLEKAHGVLGELISLPFTIGVPSQIEVVIQLTSADTELALTGLVISPSTCANESEENSKKKVAFYSGKSSELFTAVGRREGHMICSVGQEGHLVYGPYLELPVGTYRAEVHGSFGPGQNAVAHAEAISTGSTGNEPLARCELLQNSNGLLAALEFVLSSTGTVEVRIHVSSEAEVAFHSISIFTIYSHGP